MAYNAIVAKVSIAPHPNADRLQIAYIRGMRVVTGMDTKDGDMVLFFDADGQLSEEYANANDLYPRFDENGNRIGGGYFSANRRVRAQSFRQVKSEGYIAPLDSVAFTGYDISKLKEGDEFSELNGVPICNKYYTPKTLAAMKANRSAAKAIKTVYAMPEHADTTQFRFIDVPLGATVHISEKDHGTSVRYGHVLVKRPLNLFQRILRFITFKGFGEYKEGMEYVLGTRRAILPKVDEYTYGGGFYGNGDPYSLMPKLLYGKLKENEIVYGELVGFLQTGAALFTHDTEAMKDKKLTKEYGKRMVYSYGCEEGQAKFHVYRIVQNGRDLTWEELVERAAELDIVPVCNYETLVFDGNRDALNAKVEAYLEGPSVHDHRHIREGVCLRIEWPNEILGVPLTHVRIVKAKSFSFKVLEGIAKEDEENIDIEEVA